MLQPLPSIQRVGIFLSGFFEYNLEKLQATAFTNSFGYSDYYKNNEPYFSQKYYSNWLQTLYPQAPQLLADMNLTGLQSNHLYRKDLTGLSNMEVSYKGRLIPFSIHKMELHLFRENLGVFTINITLPPEYLTFQNTADLIYILRNTTDNPKYPNTNPLVSVIETQLINFVAKDTQAWRHFNPHLKLFLNIDTATAFASGEQWNNVLMDLATANAIGTMGSGSLYDFDEAYYHQLLDNNVLKVFHNWRTLFLFDAVVRISINLKEADTNNMWDNEYSTIYVFALYTQLYLFRVSEFLSGITSVSSRAARLRDDFIKFRHDFELTQISYKFLPNEIYNKLLSTLEIPTQMSKLDEKINRVDTAIRENQESRIARLLSFIAFITCFSIILDGTNLLLAELDIQQSEKQIPHQVFVNNFRLISSILFLAFLIIGFIVYRRLTRRKDIV